MELRQIVVCKIFWNFQWFCVYILFSTYPSLPLKTQILAWCLFTLSITWKTLSSEKNTIMKLCAQFYIFDAPCRKLNRSYIVTLFKLLNNVKHFKLDNWIYLDDLKGSNMFLIMFLGVYWNIRISSTHPQTSMKVFLDESKFPQFLARKSFEPIFAKICKKVGFLSVLDNSTVHYSAAEWKYLSEVLLFQNFM